MFLKLRRNMLEFKNVKASNYCLDTVCKHPSEIVAYIHTSD